MFRNQFTDVQDAWLLAHAIVDTVREPLVVLDQDLRVVAASQSFYLKFKVEADHTQGKLLYDLGDGQWDIPKLRVLIRQKQMLLEELEHRVVNSLQIIASIIMLKARAVESEETRRHLEDAHNRVISVAAVQKHLHGSAANTIIEMRPYLETLCVALAKPTECEIEARKDELGVPRLWFRSTGNPLVGLDLTGATQLQHLLTDAGEANQANEIGQHIAKAQHLR